MIEAIRALRGASRQPLAARPDMKTPTLRHLTSAERALAKEVFGTGLATEQVRILALPWWNRAFVVGPGLLVWPAETMPADFGACDCPLDTQAVFVHELTHVWQAQRGVSLLLAKLRAGDGAAAYAYDLKQGPGFLALNIEQQAMVVEDAFRLSRGGTAPHQAHLYADASRHWYQASA